MKTWFTADTHFGHENIIKYDKRPFSCVDEMDDTIINVWNSLVRKHDFVWHLGDFCFKSEKSPSWYLDRLNGRINIVWGNHDDQGSNCTKRVSGLFETCQDYKYLLLNGQKIALFHYKCEVWRNSHHGSWHLFGHSHGTLPAHGKSLDVGIMNHFYRPIEFEEIEAIMKDRPVINHFADQED